MLGLVVVRVVVAAGLVVVGLGRVAALVLGLVDLVIVLDGVLEPLLEFAPRPRLF